MFKVQSNNIEVISGTTSFKVEKHPVNFAQLPTNVLLKIFKYFNEKELLESVSRVCQKWNYVSLHPSLWKSFKIVGKEVPTNYICQILTRFPNLQEIYLKDLKDPLDVLRNLNRKLKKLKKLTLRECEVHENALRSMVFFCTELEHLDLKGTSFKGTRFYEELLNFKKLKGINLSGNQYLTIKDIITIVVNCRNLEEFHLSLYRPNSKEVLSDDDCIFILEKLSTSLRAISLDATMLTNNCFEKLFECSNLEKICFCGAYNINSRMFEETPLKFKDLREFKFRFAYQIQPDVFVRLFENGNSKWENLEVLDLTGCCKLNDDGIVAISNFCLNLKKLILRSCKNITNLEAVERCCRKLEMLNAAFCNMLELDKCLPFPNNIKIVYLSRCVNFVYLLDMIASTHPWLTIKICTSEFNKQFFYYSGK